MIRPRNEQSLAANCVVSGRGYWSGREVVVRFGPAPAGSGIRFVRTDLPGRPACTATADHACSASFRTNLVCGAAKFQMIEHAMAALTGLRIDNCCVEIDGEEFPGLDGSSQAFVEALQAVGVTIQPAVRKQLVIERTLRVGDESQWIEARPVNGSESIFEYELDYGLSSPIVAQRHREFLDPRTFTRQLAGARTFVTAEQVAELRSQGVGKHVGNRDLLVFDSDGLVDNSLRFENECARHKTLDLVGDLALAGCDLIGHFVSHRGGHRLNAEMTRLLVDVAGRSATESSDAAEFRAIPSGDRRTARQVRVA